MFQWRIQLVHWVRTNPLTPSHPSLCKTTVYNAKLTKYCFAFAAFTFRVYHCTVICRRSPRLTIVAFPLNPNRGTEAPRSADELRSQSLIRQCVRNTFGTEWFEHSFIHQIIMMSIWWLELSLFLIAAEASVWCICISNIIQTHLTCILLTAY